MGLKHMIEDRRVVARRLFGALCAQYPDKYIALIQPRDVEDGSPRGVYRERNEWRNGQNSVVVNYGTSHFDVTEDKYREDGYQPPFEELPWKPESVALDLAPTS